MITEITEKNFQEEVLEAKIPVVVDFFAPWCGPCKMISAYIDDFAKEYNGKIKVCKVNVDQAPEIATRYTIMSIPTLLVLDKGNVMEKKVGVVSKNELSNIVKPYLK